VPKIAKRAGAGVLLASGLLGGLLAATRSPARNIRTPALFGDDMVLQCQMPLPIWGTADPGGRVSVNLGGREASATVSQDGRWQVTLEPLPPGGPHTLTIAGRDTLTFSNVMLGEVWLGSGQSNMEMPLAGWGKVLDFEREIADASYRDIRLFQVERASSFDPVEDVVSEGWQLCGPETIGRFSSTAYFFGRRLHRTLGVPVGLIHSSWGGTAAEAWTSQGALEALGGFEQALAENEAARDEDPEELARRHREGLEERELALRRDDRGFEGDRPAWASPSLDDSSWESMDLPTRWERAGLPGFDGVVWFRRELKLPEGWKGQDLILNLGPIDDEDDTWFNGERLGGESTWDAPRRYTIPGSLVRPGVNLVTVRVVDGGDEGGICGRPEELRLEKGAAPPRSLAGPWRYRVGLDAASLPPLPLAPDDPNLPTVLHNAMLAPLAPFSIRGVIWYQGEANTSRAFQYRSLFPALIQDWRALWDRDDLPFYFVQLASFMAVEPEPGESEWAELREAQLATLALPHTGMAVAVDVGDAEDVHPKNKQAVGNRLARIALNRVYGRPIVHSGPTYRAMELEDDRVRVSFDHAAGGLEARHGALKGFAVAGEDRRFRWARAIIERDSVLVWSPEVPRPVAVRYAWAANPVCNLFNSAGLPASPFRTDAWPGITRQGVGAGVS